MVTPSLVAATLLGVLALTLLVDWHRQRKERAQLERQLHRLARATGVPTVEPRQLLRKAEGPGGRWPGWIGRLAPPLRGMERLLEQAGLPWKQASVAWAGLGIAAAFALAAFLAADSLLAATAAFAVGLVVPRLYVMRRRAKRMAAFESQLPEAIDLLGRSIRAGHGVTTGMRTVAEESEEPIAGEFRRVFEEQKYGLPFDESMLGLTRRVDLIDLRVMVTAILVQREVGGNLTEILDKISHLIRTRFTLRRQLRVHTAQGRLSGYVLTLLPVVVGLMLTLLDPQYISTLLVEPVGKVLVGSAIVLQMIGYVWIWRILKLDL